MKFIVCYGGSDYASFSEVQAESIEVLKQKIIADSEGQINFITDIKKYRTSDYWPEQSCLIIQGEVV